MPRARDLIERTEPRRLLGMSSAAWIVLTIALIGGIYGELYAAFFYGAGSGASDFGGFRRGFSVSALSAAFEFLYVRSDRHSWIRRTAYWKSLLVRVVVHTAAVRVGLNLNDAFDLYVLGNELAILDDLGDELRDTLLSILVVVVFAVATQIGPVVGGRRFLALASGRYFRPVRERRVFAFVDVVSSSQAALALGDERFHDYLGELFYEADPIVSRLGGEVVSYVGDGVILTWPLTDDPWRNGRALAAILALRERMRERSPHIQAEYGRAIRFRAALHCGPVVVGETGATRRQITFIGDTINRTARLEALGKALDIEILVTADMARALPEASTWTLDDAGSHAVRGMDEPLRCYSVVPRGSERKAIEDVSRSARPVLSERRSGT